MEFVLKFSVMLLQGLRSTWRRIVSIPRAWRGLVISVIFTATTLALLGLSVIIWNSFGAIFWFLIFITSPRWRRLTALFLFLGTYTVSQRSHWRLGAHHRQEEEVVFCCLGYHDRAILILYLISLLSLQEKRWYGRRIFTHTLWYLRHHHLFLVLKCSTHQRYIARLWVRSRHFFEDRASASGATLGNSGKFHLSWCKSIYWASTLHRRKQTILYRWPFTARLSRSIKNLLLCITILLSRAVINNFVSGIRRLITWSN